MGSLNRRLDALERRGHSSGTYHTPGQERRERWFAQARIRHQEVLAEPDASHARDLIRLFRTQGFLSGMDTDELVNRILAWRPEPEGGRSRNTVEREVALAIHRGEPGTEHMECLSAWRESFTAAAEIRRRFEAAPVAELAETFAALRRCEEDEEERERRECRLWDLLDAGELLQKIAGPDDVSEEAYSRRVAEPLADAVYGEKGYEIEQHIRQYIRNTESEEG